MNRLFPSFTMIALSLVAATALAVPPKLLITYNRTNYESNAFIAGVIASRHPTKAKTKGEVPWISVKMACFGHTVNNKCSALIKMATDTANPIDIGTLILDINTGEITPKQINNNGFTMTVTDLGVTTIIENDDSTGQ